MCIGIRRPVISSSSLGLSKGFYTIFLFLFPCPTTSTLCVLLTPLLLNEERHSFDRGDSVQQLLPLLRLHPPLLPLLLWKVRLWMRSWRSFSAWMLTLIHSLRRCIRWTPMSAVLPDGRLALVALWSLPLFLLRHPRKMMTPTTMMMMRMEMLALLMLTRCLLDTHILCHSWQKWEVVLDTRVVILKGRVSIGDFCKRECWFWGM